MFPLCDQNSGVIRRSHAICSEYPEAMFYKEREVHSNFIAVFNFYMWVTITASFIGNSWL